MRGFTVVVDFTEANSKRDVILDNILQALITLQVRIIRRYKNKS